jgi:hypothetical protein
MSTYDEDAKRMLHSTKGREALGKLLGIDIIPPGEQPKDDLPIVAACVPVYDHPEPRMSEAYNLMQRASAGVCKLFSVPSVSTSAIHFSRNYLLANLIKSQKPWTHVLFIDDDIIFPPDALNRLLSHRKDIVAGLCTCRTDPPIPNIRHFNSETGRYSEYLHWPEGLMEVGAVGTGMMLISRHALEQVANAWFTCLYEREFYGMSDERALALQEKRLAYFDETANAYWFQWLPCMDGTYQMGEDTSFCFMAKRYGDIKVYCDTTVACGHVGKYVYSIADFLPYRDQMVEQAKAEGRYVPLPKVDAELEIVG